MASEAELIDGKAIAADLRERIGAAVAQLRATHALQPGLAVVLVGNNPASEVYVRNKVRQTEAAGMRSEQRLLPDTVSQQELLDTVAALNADPAIHGILVQLPLPPQIDEEAIIAAIDADKDVDGFHPLNAGRLLSGHSGALVPCTPQGCVMLARHARGGLLAGCHAVVVGRSNIVGKPLALLLLAEHCTVSIAHSRTQDLDALCRQADILVAAVGRAEMIKGDWIKPGATVIDVGINRVAQTDVSMRLVGDVDFAAAREHAGAITPVPGGVGPMTIACLLRNTVVAACQQAGIAVPVMD